MKRQQITNLLEEFKTYVGLSEYKIIIKEGYFDLGEDEFAECESDIYEKSITLKIGNRFNLSKTKDREKGIDDERRYNILLHEIIHARYGIFEKVRDGIISDIEEEYINDITRGLEKLLKK